MSHKPNLLLRALSALLSYPDRELRAALPEIADVVHADRALKRGHRKNLEALVHELATGDELDVQGRYVDLFDRGRRTSLNLFEHVHGDGRRRGPAMLDLRQRYLDAGMDPSWTDQFPDYLPLMLEYLSCCDKKEIRSTIGEIEHIVRPLGNTLAKRRSRYAAVMEAILALGGAKGLDKHAPVPPPDDFERTWEERPAFAPPEHSNPAIAPAQHHTA